MRPLTEEETKTFFEKLAKYIGKNIIHLISRTDEAYCFRLHKDRVFYIQEEMMRKSTNIPRDNLICIGTCFGKFSKSGKFRMHVTALPYLSKYANYKVWLKPSGELSFLYGNHVLKAHVLRMSEEVPEHAAVVIFNSTDVPMGFGVMARQAGDIRKLEPTGVAVFHQADCGEYLRDEESMI